MKPRAFASQQAFRDWLAANHATADELVVRCFKVHASSRGLTYRQALDEALCFGWIDGVRHGVDEDSFATRFTPRRRGSSWSAVNRRRAGELEAEGRLHESGLAAFRAAEAAGARTRYSFEAPPAALAPAHRRQLEANAKAHAFFERQTPSYRRTCAFWLESAKREETRARRLALLIECSAAGRPIPPLDRGAAPRRTSKKPAPRRR